jgi:hypothetical protein
MMCIVAVFQMSSMDLIIVITTEISTTLAKKKFLQPLT